MSRFPAQAAFQAIVETSIDAVVITNRDGDIVYWNDAAAEMFGYSAEEVYGTYVHDLLPAQYHREKANESFARFKEVGTGPLVGNLVQVQGLRRNGEIFDVQFALNAITVEGEVFAYAFLRDVSHVVAMQDRLEILANVDELTSILNRRAFLKQSDIAFSMAVRHKEPLAMLMLDIDYFKRVNDEYGHHAGDAALSQFSHSIGLKVRAEDIFGRIGGEEFALVLPKTDKDAALRVAEKVRMEIANKDVTTDNLSFPISVSVGVAVLQTGDENLAVVQRRADEALYQAKSNGRNQIAFG